MGQVSSTHPGTGIEAAAGPSNPPTAAERAFTREVAAAVGILNEAGFAGQNREVTFSVDPGSHRPVVKVIKTDTKEVVTQWPTNYVLQLAGTYAVKNTDTREIQDESIF